MKRFFKEYSYHSLIMFLDQIVISLFGFGVTMAASFMFDSQNSGDSTAQIITSVCAVIFYLFLALYYPI